MGEESESVAQSKRSQQIKPSAITTILLRDKGRAVVSDTSLSTTTRRDAAQPVLSGGIDGERPRASAFRLQGIFKSADRC